MADTFEPTSARGSLWNRWEPHTHTPGTKLNDQFKGADPWAEMVRRLEQSDPPIRALGVTDYYDLAPYERVRQMKSAGQLPGVALVFPNVELRLSVGTVSGKAVNAHLLVSPDDPAHVDEIRAFLSGFEFEHTRKKYRCDRDGLIRLGRAVDGDALDDAAALSAGTNQFKVSYEALRDRWRDSPWARENILIAVSGGADGSSGLSGDASLTALRQSIENFAHVVFASSDKQVEFWSGRGKASLEQLEAIYGGPKPCLHGADAHGLEKVGRPDGDRYTWLRGDVTFETLRQACIEPSLRSAIGATPPSGVYEGRSMSSLTVTAAPWIKTGPQSFNNGLVAVIGARGSGKTALVDLAAAAAYAIEGEIDPQSFVARANKSGFLKPSTAKLRWDDGMTTSKRLGELGDGENEGDERAQYLSQHFVNQLCSAEGEDDALIDEIERIVFQKHSPEDRAGASSFGEMIDAMCGDAHLSRDHAEGRISDLSDSIHAEQEKHDSLTKLKSDRINRAEQLKREQAERTAILKRGKAGDSVRLGNVVAALDDVQLLVDEAEKQVRGVETLQQAVARFRTKTAPEYLEKLKATHSGVQLKAADWKAFGIGYVGDVEEIIAKALSTAKAMVVKLKGSVPKAAPDGSPFIAKDADLAKQPLAVLIAERDRLQKLTGLDAQNTAALRAIDVKLGQTRVQLAALDSNIKDASGAAARIDQHRADRKQAYADIFRAILEEQAALVALYTPVEGMLKDRPGTLGKLGFSVERLIDVDGWAARGLQLLDVRYGNELRGKDALKKAALAELVPAWRSGSAEAVSEAMTTFLDNHREDFIAQRPVDSKNGGAVRQWNRNFLKWFYSTDHIRVSYGITYDGLAIEQLSSGTRGIVLLVLFLALDTDDIRPLIIDQPEENLDPKSIYDELVPLFREAKRRRQIIIVTHNANLVVNTDADQVIVATAGTHSADRLPEIEYVSGGLENPVIRELVCKILEGGTRAFLDRAKRLRVTIPAT